MNRIILGTSDNHSQHFHVTAPAKDVVSPKLLKEARTAYPTYERKAEKLLFGIPKKDRPALRKKQKEQQQNRKTEADSPYEHRKKPFPLSKLSSFTRHGPSYLLEGSHAGKEEFLSLGIRGVEFGLWMSDADAQSALNQCYHALCDLAYVLDIEPHDISLGGKLSLSFGARGYGEVLADYKAKQQLITLPNGNGNGFLAHAWAYAVDEYFRQVFDESLSQMADSAFWCPYTTTAPSFVKDLLECLTRKTVMITAEEQNTLRKQKQQAMIQKAEMLLWEKLQSISPKQLTTRQQIDWDKALQEVYDHRCMAKPDMYFGANGTNFSLEKLSALHKDITGHVIPKRKRVSINRSLSNLYQSEQPYRRATQAIEQVERSNYQQGSWEMHRHFAKTSHGELYEFREKFARAFDCYIADKLQEAGIENQYLTAHADEFEFQYESGRIVYAYPIGEERKQINQKFDELILKMKELGLFHQRKEKAQNLSMDKEIGLEKIVKTSIADIQSMVAEERETMNFGRIARSGSCYGR